MKKASLWSYYKLYYIFKLTLSNVQMFSHVWWQWKVCEGNLSTPTSKSIQWHVPPNHITKICLSYTPFYLLLNYVLHTACHFFNFNMWSIHIFLKRCVIINLKTSNLKKKKKKTNKIVLAYLLINNIY